MPERFGFTLIELLVVVTIIGVLSVVGITSYIGFVKRSQDVKKKADIDNIASIYESRYNSTDHKYPGLRGQDFASGVMPDTSQYYCLVPSEGASEFNICAVLSDGSEYCKQSIHGEPSECDIPQPSPSPSPTPAPRGPPCDGFGDVNNDGFVSGADVDETVRIVAGYPTLSDGTPVTEEHRRRADVNGSGDVTSGDALQIRRYSSGVIDTFPACS